MALVTIYVIQSFVETDEGLVAEEPFAVQSAGDARIKAQLLSERKAGVVAWAKRGDPDSGEWDDDPVILFKAGKTGD
jgi:hypothetical protein